MNQAIPIVTDSLILNLADTDFQPINTDILTQGGNCVVDLEYFVIICRSLVRDVQQDDDLVHAGGKLGAQTDVEPFYYLAGLQVCARWAAQYGG